MALKNNESEHMKNKTVKILWTIITFIVVFSMVMSMVMYGF